MLWKRKSGGIVRFSDSSSCNWLIFFFFCLVLNQVDVTPALKQLPLHVSVKPLRSLFLVEERKSQNLLGVILNAGRLELNTTFSRTSSLSTDGLFTTSVSNLFLSS